MQILQPQGFQSKKDFFKSTTNWLQVVSTFYLQGKSIWFGPFSTLMIRLSRALRATALFNQSSIPSASATSTGDASVSAESAFHPQASPTDCPQSL
jgi:hypothetical protein